MNFARVQHVGVQKGPTWLCMCMGGGWIEGNYRENTSSMNYSKYIFDMTILHALFLHMGFATFLPHGLKIGQMFTVAMLQMLRSNV